MLASINIRVNPYFEFIRFLVHHCKDLCKATEFANQLLPIYKRALNEENLDHSSAFYMMVILISTLTKLCEDDFDKSMSSFDSFSTDEKITFEILFKSTIL